LCAKIPLWCDKFCGKFLLIKKDTETLELLRTGMAHAVEFALDQNPRVPNIYGNLSKDSKPIP